MTVSDLFVYGNWLMCSHDHLPADKHDALFWYKHRHHEASWNDNDDTEVVDPWSETCRSCVIVLAELRHDCVRCSREFSNCCNYRGKSHSNRRWVEILNYALHKTIAHFTWSFHYQHNYVRFKMRYVYLNVQSCDPKTFIKKPNNKCFFKCDISIWICSSYWLDIKSLIHYGTLEWKTDIFMRRRRLLGPMFGFIVFWVWLWVCSLSMSVPLAEKSVVCWIKFKLKLQCHLGLRSALGNFHVKTFSL